jgi:hypothetical protein
VRVAHEECGAQSILERADVMAQGGGSAIRSIVAAVMKLPLRATSTQYLSWQ